VEEVLISQEWMRIWLGTVLFCSVVGMIATFLDHPGNGAIMGVWAGCICTAVARVMWFVATGA